MSKISCAVVAAVALWAPGYAGPGPAPCAAAGRLEEVFSLKSSLHYDRRDCPILTAIERAAKVLDERDFPNSQASDKPQKPKNFSAVTRRTLQAAIKTKMARKAACVLLLDMAANSDESMVYHAIEMVTLMDDSGGSCSGQVTAVLGKNLDAKTILTTAGEFCVSRKEPHCDRLEGIGK